jgi:thiamine-phosphate pyrophosphorylase
VPGPRPADAPPPPLPASPARSSRLARLRGLYALVGGEEPLAQAAAALDGGAAVLQLRVKDRPAAEVLAQAVALVALARGRALVIVNDRADLAALAGADGVHLGEEDLPVAAARAVVGPDLLVGRSTRTLEDGRAALAAGADHVGFGPVFTTSSKSIAEPPRGLAMLAEVASRLPAPVVAIGGIGLDTIGAVAGAGAAAAAVIGALFDHGEPRPRAEALAAAFAAGRRR